MVDRHNAGLDEGEKMASAYERRAFIRDAAIRMAATHAGWSPANYWERAKELWDAKPEDC